MPMTNTELRAALIKDTSVEYNTPEEESDTHERAPNN